MGRLFEAIRERVTARDAAAMYGLEIGRNGRARCPWHDDRHPDLAFYEGRCYCHACHEGGDAAALTARLFGLTPLDAARKLNADFHLGVAEGAYEQPPGPSQAEIRRELREWRSKRFSEVVEVERQARTWLEGAREGWDSPAFRGHIRALALAQDELEALHAATLDDIEARKEEVEARECGRLSA